MDQKLGSIQELSLDEIEQVDGGLLGIVIVVVVVVVLLYVGYQAAHNRATAAE